MLFVVVGATDTNVRRSTGVTTANSTNIRNTVELGDQLFGHVHTAKCTVCVPYKVYSVCVEILQAGVRVCRVWRPFDKSVNLAVLPGSSTTAGAAARPQRHSRPLRSGHATPLHLYHQCERFSPPHRHFTVNALRV